ncbi:polysaccharide pyruvyl transferase family protein, partial [Neobacillus vireti]|uniref:polysaccharide pyruvyl transferase family protein n=1 Tax=Neobacillus vireti TaxID=220686 RepID=UPI0030004782
MKICTITCHDVYNHGASLQAYALMKYLSNSGHDVEIINYKPDYLSNHYRLMSINNPKWEKNYLTKSIYLLLKIPFRLPGLKRKKAFDKFTLQYLKLSKLKYNSYEELKNDPPIADAYICGSDQIWNTLHKNGKDPAFYLDFVPDEKIKGSYAASFATESILEEHKPMIKQRVSRLDRISVREKSGVKILKELDINQVVNVVDPVFLLEKNEWDKLYIKEFKEK